MARWLMVLPPVLFAGLAGLFYAGMYRSNPGELQSVFVGRPAPAVPATALPGIPGLTDADLKTGKVTVVNFWATWCAPCREEMPSLDALQAELGGDDFQVVAIAAGHNPPAAIQKFLTEAEIANLPVRLDPRQGLAREMGVMGMPVTVLIDRDGNEIARLIGGADWASEASITLIRQATAP